LKHPFVVGDFYSRKDIYKIVNVPIHKQKGAWNTGYTIYDDSAFIFANLGVPGTTGHDYANLLVGNILHWYSKTTDTIHVPRLKRIMSGEIEVYIFTRTDSKNVNFIFQGLGTLVDYDDIKPAYVAWELHKDITPIPFSNINAKVKERIKFLEGTKTTSITTRYERNPKARKECLDHYGYDCQVCDFNFLNFYGDIGKDYIHVHHLVEISTIGDTYEIDPIKDLRPVCPNCHAILHKRKPAFSINELKTMLTRK